MVTLDLARVPHMSSADRIPPSRLVRQTQGRGTLNWLRRINNQKTLARERGEEISDEEARRREVAKLHRPKLKVPIYNPNRYGPLYNPRLYDGAEVVQGRERVPLPNCVALEPTAVHSRRDYDKITTEVGRMIAEGNAQPEEIRFICSAFFILRRSGEDWLVRFGERRYPYKINEGRLRVNYTGGTVTLDESLTIKVKSVGIFDHYFGLYTMLVKHRP
jgi:hypothetical protein